MLGSSSNRQSPVDFHSRLSNLLARHQQELRAQVLRPANQYREQPPVDPKTPFPTKDSNYFKSSTSNIDSATIEIGKNSFRKMIQTHLKIDSQQMTLNANVIQRNPDFLDRILGVTYDSNLPQLKGQHQERRSSSLQSERIRDRKSSEQISDSLESSNFVNLNAQKLNFDSKNKSRIDSMHFKVQFDSLDSNISQNQPFLKDSNISQNQPFLKKSSLKYGNPSRIPQINHQSSTVERTNSKAFKKTVCFVDENVVSKAIKDKPERKFSFFCCS